MASLHWMQHLKRDSCRTLYYESLKILMALCSETCRFVCVCVCSWATDEGFCFAVSCGLCKNRNCDFTGTARRFDTVQTSNTATLLNIAMKFPVKVVEIRWTRGTPSDEKKTHFHSALSTCSRAVALCHVSAVKLVQVITVKKCVPD